MCDTARTALRQAVIVPRGRNAALQFPDIGELEPGSAAIARPLPKTGLLDMMTVRMYADWAGKGWVIVRCIVCADVERYTATAAFDAPVQCKCGHLTSVRDTLMAEFGLRSTPGEPARGFGGAFTPGDMVLV